MQRSEWRRRLPNDRCRRRDIGGLLEGGAQGAELLYVRRGGHCPRRHRARSVRSVHAACVVKSSAGTDPVLAFLGTAPHAMAATGALLSASFGLNYYLRSAGRATASFFMAAVIFNTSALLGYFGAPHVLGFIERTHTRHYEALLVRFSLRISLGQSSPAIESCRR